MWPSLFLCAFQPLDRIAVRFRTLIELVPVAIAFLDLLEQVERFVILKIYPHRVSIILNVGLIGRRIMAEHCFGSRIVYIFPVGVDVAS